MINWGLCGRPDGCNQRDRCHSERHCHYTGSSLYDSTLEIYFLDGQVIKYILRAGAKPGESTLTDHRKALWYLQRKIANEEKERK